MKRKKKEKNLPMETLIGADTVLEGSIYSERSICVEGSVRGRIEARGEVVVGRQGKVESDVHASSVVVSGRIVGDIIAQHLLEISATGRVTGDVEVAAIRVAEGGALDGCCKMTKDNVTEFARSEKLIPIKAEKLSDLGSDPKSTGRRGRASRFTLRRHLVFHFLAFLIALVLLLSPFLGSTYFQERWHKQLSNKQLAQPEQPVAKLDKEVEEQEEVSAKAKMESVMKVQDTPVRPGT